MQNINTQTYAASVDAMIQKNRELLRSYQDLANIQSQINRLLRQMNSTQSHSSRTGNIASHGLADFIRSFGHRPHNNGNSSQRMSGLVNQANSIISSIFGSASNTSTSSRTGARSISSSLSNIIRQLNVQLRPAMDSIFGGNMLKNIMKTSTMIGLVATSMNHIYKSGDVAYKASVKLQNAMTQLGDGAKYAYDYAVKLNDEMGTPLNKSMSAIAGLSGQLKGTGGWSSGAAGVATGAYGVANKVGLYFQNDPTEVFDKIQEAILTGQNTLLEYNVNVSDDVLAGWLAAKKGINMYAVELSQGAKQAYRWMMIQEQLADVTSYSGDLTNTTFAKQLQMMNQLEDIGLKLRAMLMPMFAWIVDNVGSVVDSVLGAINTIREALGMEAIETSVTNIVQRDQSIVSAIDKQNAAYKKQGEILKKNQNQRLSFDEWISLDAINQLNDALEKSASEGFDAMGSLSGDGIETTGKGADLAIDKDSIKNQLSKMTPSEIKAKIDVANKEELNDIWSNLNFIQKGQYGTDIGVKFLLEGDIPKAIEALLFGAAGSFTGINAIKELMEGDYLGTLAEGAQAILFLFGGWQGKIASAVGEIVGIIAGLGGVDDKTQHILTLTGSVLTMLFGWKGAIVAIGLALVPVAAKLGQMTNQFFNGLFGSSGVWGSIQSFDSRAAANMEFGEGTPEAEARYYELMKEKFGDTDIPKYAKGGIALNPHVAEIGHGTEAVIPLDSPEGMDFARSLASMVVNDGNYTQNANDDARLNSVTINVPISNYMGDESSLRLLVERLHNMILDIERNEGGSFYGSY